MTTHEGYSPLDRLIRALPIIGYVIRCLEEERHKELALLGANLFMSVLLVGLIWGYAGIITVMLTLVAVIIPTLVLVTLG